MNVHNLCDPRKVFVVENSNSFLGPISVEISPTNICNMNCSYCSYKVKKRQGESLSEEVFNQLVDDVIALGVKAVYFTGGGEPLLYPYIEKAIEKLYNSKIKIAVITNGILENILENVIGYCSYILVNVTAEQSTISKRRIIPLERNLTRIKNNSECLVGARYVLTKENYSRAEEEIKRLITVGYDYIQCTPAVDYESGSSYVSESLLEELSCKNVFHHPKVMLAKKNEGCKKDEFNFERCLAIERRFHVAIAANGTVNICPYLSRCSNLGNINSIRLISLWNNDYHKSLIAKIQDNYSQKDCKFCRFLAYNQLLEEAETVKKNPHVYFL